MVNTYAKMFYFYLKSQEKIKILLRMSKKSSTFVPEFE